MAWIYSDTVYCFRLWGFIQKVARHPIVIQFKMLLPNCIVLLRLSRHAFGEVCCCCVAVRPWTGQRPLDKSDNILSLFHEWIASDVVSIEIWGKIEIPTSQCRKLRCQVPWLATVSKISLLRTRYPRTNLTSSWVDFMNMVAVYIWICDFGLLEIKQNGYKIFRGQAPLSRYISTNCLRNMKQFVDFS